MLSILRVRICKFVDFKALPFSFQRVQICAFVILNLTYSHLRILAYIVLLIFKTPLQIIDVTGSHEQNRIVAF